MHEAQVREHRVQLQRQAIALQQQEIAATQQQVQEQHVLMQLQRQLKFQQDQIKEQQIQMKKAQERKQQQEQERQKELELQAKTLEEEAGLLMEAEVFPGSGAKREGKATVDDWFQDKRYRRLALDDMASLLYFFDSDSCVRTAAEIFYSMLFSGGISFERDEFEMDSASKQWYTTTYLGWAQCVDRYNMCLGFCPCVKQKTDKYVAMPTVLNLDRCIILFRRDVFGFPHFVFFEQPDDDLTHEPRYIPDVIVYIETAPATSGELISKLRTLAADERLYSSLLEAAEVAVRHRCNPLLVLQEDKGKHDPESMLSVLHPAADSVLYGDGAAPYQGEDRDAGGAAGRSYNRLIQEQEEKRKYDYARAVSILGAGGVAKATEAANRIKEALSSREVKEHYLAAHRVLAKQTLAESPDDLLLQFRTARMERIFNLFGIPLGMISQTSSLGTGEKQAQNQEVYTVFVHTQRQKRQQLLGYIRDMYDRIYRVHHVLQKMKSTPKGEEDSLSTDSDVVIQMAGMPEDASVDALFTMGALKYEAFIKFKSDRHGIPLEYFNEECELSLQDINGVKDNEEGGSEGGGSDSKSKGKSKSKGESGSSKKQKTK